MKKFTLKLLLFFLTFSVGFSVYRYCDPYLKVSLEEISRNSEVYDGKYVEIVSYIRVESHLISRDEAVPAEELIVGDDFENYEYPTILNLEKNSINLDSLRSELSENYTLYKFKRMKVRVSGKITDNCRKGGVTCCFGHSMTLVLDKIKQIEPIEDYSLPERYKLR